MTNALLIVGVLALLLWIIVPRARSASRRRYLSEYITNNMPSGMVTLDRSGIITSHNPASQRIFGYELNTGRRLSDLVDEGPRATALVGRCLSSGATFTREEFNLTDTTGHRRRIGVNFSPITAANGEIDGVICLLSDLTEVVKLQEQIRLKDNFAALGEMSAGIAHEFKNSLATISGYSQMLVSATDTDQMRTFAGEIDQETRALSQIVSDFLHFARPVKTSMRATELRALVDDVVEDVRGSRPGSYAMTVSSTETPDVLCDSVLFRQAISNLLINAVEAIGEAGHVEVDITFDEARNEVRLKVSDDGPGVDPQGLQKVFIPFFTTKPSGTGLGLPLVQKIVLAHEGTIAMDSSVGNGTEVTICLPSVEQGKVQKYGKHSAG